MHNTKVLNMATHGNEVGLSSRLLKHRLVLLNPLQDSFLLRNDKIIIIIVISHYNNIVSSYKCPWALNICALEPWGGHLLESLVAITSCPLISAHGPLVHVPL